MKLSSFVVSLVLISSSTLAFAAEPAGKTYDIFDGKSLAGWKKADFGGQDEVSVDDGKLIIPVGQDMSGLTWDVKNPPLGLELPKEDYELNLEAMRVDGSDFFCGITFPVGDAPCSLILGGWGGGVVGLSSINGNDASENDTTQFVPFENNHWYKVRLRVTKERISAWLDDKEIIDIERGDKKFSIRSEVELNRPLGFSTWQTKGALRNITLTVFQQDAGEDEVSPSDRPIETPVAPAEPPVAEPAAPTEAAPTVVEPAAGAVPSCTSAPASQCNCGKQRCRVRRCGRRCR